MDRISLTCDFGDEHNIMSIRQALDSRKPVNLNITALPMSVTTEIKQLGMTAQIEFCVESYVVNGLDESKKKNVDKVKEKKVENAIPLISWKM